jgi:hypothetical protein
VTSICNAQGLVRAEDAQNAQGQTRKDRRALKTRKDMTTRKD